MKYTERSNMPGVRSTDVQEHSRWTGRECKLYPMSRTKWKVQSEIFSGVSHKLDNSAQVIAVWMNKMRIRKRWDSRRSMTAVVITTDRLSGGFISVRTLRGCGGLFRRRSFRIFNGVTPRFFRGFVSLWRWGRIRHTERALSRYAKLIIFIGGKFGKLPLITLVIIVIHICVNEGLRLFIAFAGFRLSADMILHMTEETFPRRVIPTVSPSGHGLAQIFVLKNPNKFAACVMRPLIAVRDGFLMKRYPVGRLS